MSKNPKAATEGPSVMNNRGLRLSARAPKRHGRMNITMPTGGISSALPVLFAYSAPIDDECPLNSEERAKKKDPRRVA